MYVQYSQSLRERKKLHLLSVVQNYKYFYKPLVLRPRKHASNQKRGPTPKTRPVTQNMPPPQKAGAAPKTQPAAASPCSGEAAAGVWAGVPYSANLALRYSRLRRAMLLRGTFLGHSAAQAPVLVQLPKPSSSILATMARARRLRSTWPWGSRANWLTLAETKSIAEPFLQAATQAPQPMQVALSVCQSYAVACHTDKDIMPFKSVIRVTNYISRARYRFNLIPCVSPFCPGCFNFPYLSKIGV